MLFTLPPNAGFTLEYLGTQFNVVFYREGVITGRVFYDYFCWSALDLNDAWS